LATSEELGIAVSCRFAVPALSFKCSTFSLVWFMPVVHFGGKSRSYKRWYTRYVGEESGSIEKLVDSALIEGENWRLEIEKWQEPVINDKSLPEWYKSALFNELYYVVDGAAFWFEYDSSWKDIEKINPITEKQLRKFGRFGYMESWEYLMINTYDVHFYASWAFVKNWPQLELSIQLEFCDQLNRTDARTATSLKEGKRMDIKTYSRIPHDIGNPHEEPWAQTNAYILHDTAEWRDLNLKFVLSCWRDYILIVEKKYDRESALKILAYFYKQSETIVRNALSEWDIDEDGMIENSGIADQTYDVWTMSGTSAYCGSLWLAALSCVSYMAEELGKDGSSLYFEDVLARAKEAFVKKLWNGSEDGSVDISSIQSEEVWTGIGYSLASFMIAKGKRNEGFDTARGMFEKCWNRLGLQYQTPEAIYEEKYYRAIGYMRPLAIWAIQHALEMRTI
ncbi:hypothetical protein ANCCEY_10478, partial [Ancylostoma ceylanicum]